MTVPGGGDPGAGRPDGVGRLGHGLAGRRWSASPCGHAVFSVVAIVVGALALTGLGSARQQVVTRLDPASLPGLAARGRRCSNQETGVRGYALTGQQVFLQPYPQGVAASSRRCAGRCQVLAGDARAEAEVARVLSKAADWRTGYAHPGDARRQATGKVRPARAPDAARPTSTASGPA